MSDPVARLAIAEIEAAVARERLAVTLNRLQARLNPKSLARQTARDVADKGGEIANAGVEAVRRHPGALVGSVAVAGLILGRHRIATLFGRKPSATPTTDPR